LADENGKKFSRFWLHHVGGGLVWLNFPTAYSFVMISPNLHAIWVFLLMNLSQDLKCFLLIYFGTLGDGYSLKGSKK
jgi:hypothetical protein